MELEKALGIYDGDDEGGSGENVSENTDSTLESKEEESNKKDKDDSDDSYHW